MVGEDELWMVETAPFDGATQRSVQVVMVLVLCSCFVCEGERERERERERELQARRLQVRSALGSVRRDQLQAASGEIDFNGKINSFNEIGGFGKREEMVGREKKFQMRERESLREYMREKK